MNLVAVWWRTIRGSFFTTSVIPVFLGASLAVSEGAPISWRNLMLSLAVACTCHAGSNLINDYYDHLSTNDDINDFRSPFNGGSGSIQDGIVKPLEIRRAAVFCFALCFAFGMVLFVPDNAWALLLVLAGILSGICYSKFPGLSYLGLGELVVGLNFGPLIVASAYLAQAGKISVGALVISIPVGLMVAAVLYINQFPDYEADKAVNRKNIVVRLGLRRALPYYYLLLAGAYVVIVMAVHMELIPSGALVVLLTLPLALTAVFVTAKWYDHPVKILPANACTVVIQFSTGVLLTVSFVWSAVGHHLPGLLN